MSELDSESVREIEREREMWALLFGFLWFEQLVIIVTVVSHHGCSLTLNSVPRADLYFYVRGSRFTNISLLLLW